jgi:hypothetical protein
VAQGAAVTANVVLAYPQPGSHDHHPAGVTCASCTAHYGFTFRPTVTIRPQRAMRLPSGAILIENPTVLCAQCQARGIETVL